MTLVITNYEKDLLVNVLKQHIEGCKRLVEHVKDRGESERFCIGEGVPLIGSGVIAVALAEDSSCRRILRLLEGIA